MKKCREIWLKCREMIGQKIALKAVAMEIARNLFDYMLVAVFMGEFLPAFFGELWMYKMALEGISDREWMAIIIWPMWLAFYLMSFLVKFVKYCMHINEPLLPIKVLQYVPQELYDEIKQENIIWVRSRWIGRIMSVVVVTVVHLMMVQLI